jgi:NAD-dependent DNA ligase
MGYSTEFSGELTFTKELTAKQLAKVKSFLGEDCREHKEWGDTDLTYIDLELLDDFSGLKWDGAEKTYDLVEKVNLLVKNVQKDYPDFGLTGMLSAQGEDPTDRWVLVMENGKAVERKSVVKGKKVTCPHCDEEFLLEESEDDNSGEFVFVFTGFRHEEMKDALEEAGHKVDDNVSKRTTHLVMKDVFKNSNKKIKAEEIGCKIWSLEQLNEFVDKLN